MGPDAEVVKAREEMMSIFECDDVGEVNEYLGCKVERRSTQPVILQSFDDEFNLPEGRVVNTPAFAGTVLNQDVEEENFSEASAHGKYRTGVGKLLHVTRSSRLEIWNTVRELTRAVKGSSRIHFVAMERVMKYCVDTPKRGWVFKPRRTWDGKSKLEFEVSDRSDSDYAKCPVTRKSVRDHNVKLEGAVVIVKSGMQNTLSQA